MEKKNYFSFLFLWISFLYSLSKLCTKSLNLHHHICIYFMLFSAATPKDTNIVIINEIVLYSYCLLKTCVIEWCTGLFFL